MIPKKLLYCYSPKFLSVPSTYHTCTKVVSIALYQIFKNVISAQFNTVTSQKYRRNIADGMVLILFWYDLYRRMKRANRWLLTHLFLINKNPGR